MKRKITEQLVAWKNRQGHKPLILQGARQVGKSYILEKLGEEHYKNLTPSQAEELLKRCDDPYNLINYNPYYYKQKQVNPYKM